MHPRFRSSLSVGVELRGSSKSPVFRVVSGRRARMALTRRFSVWGRSSWGSWSFPCISSFISSLLSNPCALFSLLRLSVAESVPVGPVSAADVAVHRVRLLLHRVHRAGDQFVLLSFAIGLRLEGRQGKGLRNLTTHEEVMLPPREIIRRSKNPQREYYLYSEGWKRNLKSLLFSRKAPSLVVINEVWSV